MYVFHGLLLAGCGQERSELQRVPHLAAMSLTKVKRIVQLVLISS